MIILLYLFPINSIKGKITLSFLLGKTLDKSAKKERIVDATTRQVVIDSVINLGAEGQNICRYL